MSADKQVEEEKEETGQVWCYLRVLEGVDTTP